MLLVKNLEAQLGLSLPSVFVAQDLNPDKLWQLYFNTSYLSSSCIFRVSSATNESFFPFLFLLNNFEYVKPINIKIVSFVYHTLWHLLYYAVCQLHAHICMYGYSQIRINIICAFIHKKY